MAKNGCLLSWFLSFVGELITPSRYSVNITVMVFFYSCKESDLVLYLRRFIQHIFHSLSVSDIHYPRYRNISHAKILYLVIRSTDWLYLPYPANTIGRQERINTLFNIEFKVWINVLLKRCRTLEFTLL